MSPRAFTDKEREIVRRRLIDAGKRFFATTGVKKTSVETLAKAAGISKGAFYQFYNNKELLFMDALDEENQRMHDVLIKNIQLASSKQSGFVSAVIETLRDLMAHPWIVALASQEYDMLLARLPKERILQHIEKDDASSQRFCAALGVDIDPELLSAVLRMLFIGMMHQREVGDRAQEAFEYMLEALAARLFGEETP